jgi:hypothetical protein
MGNAEAAQEAINECLVKRGIPASRGPFAPLGNNNEELERSMSSSAAWHQDDRLCAPCEGALCLYAVQVLFGGMVKYNSREMSHLCGSRLS